MSAVVSAAALAVIGALFPTTPANAAPSDCAAGTACLFKDYEFQGEVLRLRPGCYNLPSQYNDTASSVVNNTGEMLTLYQNYNGRGKYVNIWPNTSDNRLDYEIIYNEDNTFFGWNTFNDRASSYCLR
ncbi:peptidase inhibitor family I36 protein [Streptosporangium sp. NPDC049644]|uniref:peptidase inhibitor family I36 protein n=1 Tax=Streptosporangium sp. NPDC049644 TaxID=3155507 RepID=UPI0034140DC5